MSTQVSALHHSIWPTIRTLALSEFFFPPWIQAVHRPNFGHRVCISWHTNLMSKNCLEWFSANTRCSSFQMWPENFWLFCCQRVQRAKFQQRWTTGAPWGPRQEFPPANSACKAVPFAAQQGSGGQRAAPCLLPAFTSQCCVIKESHPKIFIVPEHSASINWKTFLVTLSCNLGSSVPAMLLVQQEEWWEPCRCPLPKCRASTLTAPSALLLMSLSHYDIIPSHNRD